MLKKGWWWMSDLWAFQNQSPACLGWQHSAHFTVWLLKFWGLTAWSFCAWSCHIFRPSSFGFSGTFESKRWGNTKEPWFVTVGVTQLLFLSQRSLVLAFPQHCVIYLHVVHVGPLSVTILHCCTNILSISWTAQGRIWHYSLNFLFVKMAEAYSCNAEAELSKYPCWFILCGQSSVHAEHLLCCIPRWFHPGAVSIPLCDSWWSLKGSLAAGGWKML